MKRPSILGRRSFVAIALSALLFPQSTRATPSFKPAIRESPKLWPSPLRAGNVSQTCPPLFIRDGDPEQVLFETDLYHWALTNRHVRQAFVSVHPSMSRLIPPMGKAVEFKTVFTITPGPLQMPAPWVIAAACQLDAKGQAL